MNWNDLQYLLAAARHRSLTDAARELRVNQTTVSRRLQSLQDDLGVRLFDRTSKGLEVTAAGEELVQAARSVEDVLAAVNRKVLGGDAQLKGELRITTIDLIAHYHPDLFDTFSLKYPEVALELSVGYTSLNLTRREADLAIRFASAPPDQLIARHIVTAKYAPYAARSLVKARGNKKKMPSNLPWLSWDESMGARATDRWIATHAPGARIACRFDLALAMHSALRAGMGAAIIPCAYGDADPKLVRLAPPDPGLSFDLWLLVHPDLRKNARVRAFLDHALDYFGKWIPAFEGKTR